MSNSHPYFTRSKTRTVRRINKTTTSSRTRTNINTIMASLSPNNEETNHGANEPIVKSQPNSSLVKEYSTDDIKIPSSSISTTSPTRPTSDLNSLLQQDVELLKIQLQQLRPFAHTQPGSNPSATVTTSAVQYVINIDPLQQMKDFVKPFNGSSEVDPRRWLDSITNFFDIVRLPGNREDLCFQYGPAFLKAYALRWWTDNKDCICDWRTFCRTFLEQFAERNEYLLEQQLQQRKQQPSEPVVKYYYDMIELCHRCDPAMPDRQKIRKLIHGLRLPLFQEAIKDEYTTPKEFLRKIQQLENLEKLVELRQNFDGDSSSTHFHEPKPFAADSSTLPTYTTRPNFSSPSPAYVNAQTTNDVPYPYSPPSEQPVYQSHSLSYRPQRRSMTTGSTSRSNTSHPQQPRVQCYECGQWGHIARNCYTRQATPRRSPTTYQKNY